MDKISFLKSLSGIKGPYAAVAIIALGGIWAVVEIAKMSENSTNAYENIKCEFQR